MKLLFVNSLETTAPGGINTAVREVGAALALRGHRVTVLQPNPHHRQPEELCKGFRIQRVHAPLANLLYGFDVLLWKDIAALYRTTTPDVVHVHGFHSLFSAEAVHFVRRMDADVPLVFSFHLDVSTGAVFRASALGRVQTTRKKDGRRTHPRHRVLSV